MQMISRTAEAMKKLLIFAALFEALTGLVLLVYPPLPIVLLFGSALDDAGLLVARIAGIALLSLAVACWPEGNLFRAFLAMLIYGALVMLCLVYAWLTGVAGILLWPAVATHGVLSVLLVWAWRNGRRTPETDARQRQIIGQI
jgi:hypothetical protein